MDFHSLPILVFILCIMSEVDSQPACPSGFAGFENSCYYFGRRERTWADAREQCVNLCSYLVHVTSAEENMFLVNRLRQDNRELDHWIGITDGRSFNTTEGRFVLASVPAIPIDFIGYNNWRDGEPNDADGTANCVHMWADGDLEWDDTNCQRQKLYICEKDGGLFNTCGPRG